MMAPTPAEDLSRTLVGGVLEKLGLSARPAPTVEGLSSLYAAWCRHVPFDNVRKLIHLHRKNKDPLPGDTAADFFEAWLRHGAGGTCWAGNGALHCLLKSLGFAPVRGIATMLVNPNVPPNHGTVVVACEGKRYIVDASILHGKPLHFDHHEPEAEMHRAWGAQLRVHAGQRIIHWRPLHKPDGFDCRIDRIDVSAEAFHDSYEQTRPWSPFNYQLHARLNRDNSVIGTALGQRIEFDQTGTLVQRVLNPDERIRFIVEEMGISEELAATLPPDAPTPPAPH